MGPPLLPVSLQRDEAGQRTPQGHWRFCLWGALPEATLAPPFPQGLPFICHHSIACARLQYRPKGWSDPPRRCLLHGRPQHLTRGVVCNKNLLNKQRGDPQVGSQFHWVFVQLNNKMN